MTRPQACNSLELSCLSMATLPTRCFRWEESARLLEDIST